MHKLTQLRLKVCARSQMHTLTAYFGLQTQNPGWHEVVWDEAAVLDLIQQDFPWFLPTYLSYPKLVQRSDVMRYLVLYKYGGVYLDADVSTAYAHCMLHAGL